MDKLPYLRLEQKCGMTENQEINPGRFRTSSAHDRFPHRRKPLFSYALPCHTTQSGRSECVPSGQTNGYDSPNCWQLGQTFRRPRNQGIIYTFWTRSQSHQGLLGRGSCVQSHRIRPTECPCSPRSLAECFGQGSERIDVQTFFIRIGARYRCIRKCPKGEPSLQQELEVLFEKGAIDLFYGDESHICTEGYVPYGGQFSGEDVYIPVEKAKRLNIFRMIDRNNRFEGGCTCESVDAEKVVDFLDRFSFKLNRKTFVVLDNASVHRNEKIKRMRPMWEKRGLFLFYIPPYSPHLNIVETLWRIMKGKWLRPQDYATTEALFMPQTGRWQL